LLTALLASFGFDTQSLSAQGGQRRPPIFNRDRDNPLNNSAPGDAIYEPFCGSGTTIIAAETIGRICLAMEIDPAYVDVAVRRWQTFTGRPAVLAGEDRVFNDVARARGNALAA
jgi:hypothetical protein